MFLIHLSLSFRLRSLLREAGLTAPEAEKEAPSTEQTPNLSRTGSHAADSITPPITSAAGVNSDTGNAAAAALQSMTSPIRRPLPATVNTAITLLRPIPMLSRIGSEEGEGEEGSTGNSVGGGPASPLMRTPSLHPPGFPEKGDIEHSQPHSDGLNFKLGRSNSASSEMTDTADMAEYSPHLSRSNSHAGHADNNADKKGGSGSRREKSSGNLSPKEGFVEKKRSIATAGQHKIPGSPIRRKAKDSKDTKAKHGHGHEHGRGQNQHHRHHPHQTLVIDVGDMPGFMESRPPVFQIKADDAFIC